MRPSAWRREGRCWRRVAGPWRAHVGWNGLSAHRREGDGTTPFGEILLRTTSRVRRGMAAIAITPSRDPVWVRPLTALRQRGVGCRVIWLDSPAFEAADRAAQAERAGEQAEPDGEDAMAARRPARVIAHALAEFDLPFVTVGPGANLEAALTVRPARSGQLVGSVMR